MGLHRSLLHLVVDHCALSCVQLCINLANERLQGYFQQCVFAAEEEVHRLEGVPWPADLEYHDNSGCISLISGSIFRLLDEACDLQSSSEVAFFQRVSEQCMRDPFFAAARRKKLRDDEGFVVRHFAGDVCYCSATAAAVQQISSADWREAHASTDSWIVKNADRLLPELAVELKNSTMPIVSSLFAGDSSAGDNRARSSVVRRFCAELDSLLRDLSQTQTRFIRCIKPNTHAAPRVLEHVSVLAQLRCLGMTEVVQMMHKAFPTRIEYAMLHGRYAKGMPAVLANLPPRDFCEAVALLCEVPPADMHLGMTRLFLRGGKGLFLEDLRDMDVATVMPLLLAKIDQMNKRRSAGQIIACAVCMYHLRTRYLRIRWACSLIVRVWRGALGRIRARELKQRLEEKLALTPKKSLPATPEVGGLAEEEKRTSSPVVDVADAEAVVRSKQARSPTRSPSKLTEETLFSALKVEPLSASQLRAVQSLRQRLGEHLAENTDIVDKERRVVKDPESGAHVTLAPRRRLKIPTQQTQSQSATPVKRILPTGLPPTDEGDGESTLQVALSRDARDGTLGIDLDQFTGRPTIAIVVKGGPAERDGSVRAGDILTAVDGIECSSISDVIAVLSSPSASAKNPLTVTVLRKAKFAVADDVLLVRASPRENASDGIAGMSGNANVFIGAYAGPTNSGLYKLREWTPCRCRLDSNRRLTIKEHDLGVDAAFGLRSAEMVALIRISKGLGFDDKSLSCLQIRTADGILEFCSPGETPEALYAWQRPLESMLMLSLSAVVSGWMYNLSAMSEDLSIPSADMIPRVYFDLNNLTQLRTVAEDPRPEGVSHVGVIDLIELQSVQLVKLTKPITAHTTLAGTTEVLHISTADANCILACEEPAMTQRWVDELQAAHSRALVSLVQYTGMILIDGWLEYQGDEDEWASGFFVLTIGSGLQCFEDAVRDPADADPIETLALETITGAVRSKGIDYYDWCIDVRTDDMDYIRVRPPRQSDMSRWLATLNLYCTPPQKRKPEKPGRYTQQEEVAAGGMPQTSSADAIPADSAVAEALPAPRAPATPVKPATPLMPSKQVTPQMPSKPAVASALLSQSPRAMKQGARAMVESNSLNPVVADAHPSKRTTADIVLKPEPQKHRKRAASFGTRRQGRSSKRNSDEAAAAPTPAQEPPCDDHSTTPSHGGRLHAAKAVPRGAAPVPPSGLRAVLHRRPSFSRRRSVPTKAATEADLSSKLNNATETAAAPAAEEAAPQRRRALSFTRRRPPKWTGSAPAAAPVADAPATATAAALAPAPATAIVYAPAAPPAPAAPGAGLATRTRLRRAASFGRRRP